MPLHYYRTYYYYTTCQVATLNSFAWDRSCVAVPLSADLVLAKDSLKKKPAGRFDRRRQQNRLLRSVGLLSVGLLSVGLLSVGLLRSVGLLSAFWAQAPQLRWAGLGCRLGNRLLGCRLGNSLLGNRLLGCRLGNSYLGNNLLGCRLLGRCWTGLLCRLLGNRLGCSLLGFCLDFFFAKLVLGLFYN
jgi:hypothetical protein